MVLCSKTEDGQRKSGQCPNEAKGRRALFGVLRAHTASRALFGHKNRPSHAWTGRQLTATWPLREHKSTRTRRSFDASYLVGYNAKGRRALFGVLRAHTASRALFGHKTVPATPGRGASSQRPGHSVSTKARAPVVLLMQVT